MSYPSYEVAYSTKNLHENISLFSIIGPHDSMNNHIESDKNHKGQKKVAHDLRPAFVAVIAAIWNGNNKTMSQKSSRGHGVIRHERYWPLTIII
jgi:hypothetical protein